MPNRKVLIVDDELALLVQNPRRPGGARRPDPERATSCSNAPGADAEVFDRTLDRHIANLRARIEIDPANPRYVVTVFGIGYKTVKPE
jgi:hypothetical protein